MTITINGTTGIAGVDGSASTPAVQGTDTNTGVFFPAADTIAFGEGGAEVARFDSSGNLGLSVTPSAWSIGTALQVKRASFYTYNNDSVEIVQNGAVISGAWQRIGADFATKYGQETGNHIWSNAASSTAGSAITWSERARITSGGFFKASDTGTYVGSTGPYHELYTSKTNENIAYFTNSGASPYGPFIYFSGATPNNTTNYFLRGDDTTNVKFFIYSSGTVTNRTGTYNTISDIKLKQDITDASSQWNDIKALRIVKYRLKDEVAADPNYPAYIGVVAQEVEQVSPGLIDNCVDKDTGEVTKSVKSSIIYMKAVKALQEAMDRIETLEAQNAAFEARLAALEAK
jgi:hypothetical protein